MKNVPTREKLSNAKCAATRRLSTLGAGIMSGLLFLMPTFCAPKTVQMNSVFTKFIDIICTVAFYVGALIIVGGIFNWVLAQKDENADAQSRAIKFIVVGFVLVALKTVIAPILGLF